MSHLRGSSIPPRSIEETEILVRECRSILVVERIAERG
jgi:hypothetical protein